MLQQLISSYAAGTVILVKLEEATRTFHPIGSAFVCHGKGYLLTAAHIVKLDMKLGIIVQQVTTDFQPFTIPEAQVFSVSIAGFDAANDVALLKIEEPMTVGVPDGMFGNDAETALGELCGYVGFPFADRGLHVRHVASANLSAKVISASGARQYQLDSMIHEGCSGGPLVNIRTGRIIGVMAGRYAPSGASPSVFIGGRPVGTDSAISYATCIEYGLALMMEAGLEV